MDNKDRRIGLNYIFYTLYQIISLITPLITTPYVSRVLHSDGVGQFSYTHAIAHYVTIIVCFGTTIYGNRKMAFMQGNRQLQSQIFCQIFSLRIVMLLFGGIIYFLICLFGNADGLLMAIQGIYLVAEVFNIDWVFTGNEDFKITVTRSFGIKILGIIAIFLWVKDASDIYLYAIIMGVSIWCGNIIMWRYLPRYVDKIAINFAQAKKNIYGSVKMFMPQLAGSLYIYFDKIMLGMLSQSSSESGYYEQTQKIIRLALTLITTLPTVMLPRMANMHAQNEEEKSKKYLSESLRFVFVMGIPITMGIIAISDGMVEWFFGKEFQEVKILLKFLAPVVIFNGVYNVIGYQYFLATKQEMKYTTLIFGGAFANILLNLLLIPRYMSLGAIIGSLVAEAVVAISMAIYVRKRLDVFILGKSIVKSVLSGSVMGVVVWLVNCQIGFGIWQTFISVFVGIIVYFCLELLLKEQMVLETLGKILRRNRG